jgi:hypothetical protein
VAIFCQCPIIQANFIGDNAVKNEDGFTLGGSVAVPETGELIGRSHPKQTTPLIVTMSKIAEKSKKTETPKLKASTGGENPSLAY